MELCDEIRKFSYWQETFRNYMRAKIQMNLECK